MLLSLLFLQAMFFNNEARAAETHNTTATITDLKFTDEVLEFGRDAELTGNWSLPNNPATPAGFILDLPADLRGQTDTFPLTETSDPNSPRVGECTLTPTQLHCDIDTEYIRNNPLNLKGGFNLWVKVRTERTEDTEVVYNFGNYSTTVPATVKGMCPDGCVSGLKNHKSGTYDQANQTVEWYVKVESGPEGMEGGENVRLEDKLGPNLEYVFERDGQTYPYLVRASEFNANGRPVFSRVSDDLYTVENEGTTISFEAEAGYHYEARWLTRVVDAGASVVYTNSVDYFIENELVDAKNAQVTYRGGGGTGSGDNVGSFTINKTLLGDVTGLEELIYTGGFSIELPGGETATGSFEVPAGGTWLSDQYPVGSVVTLTENLPQTSNQIEWLSPRFSDNGFSIVAGSPTDIELINEANIATGSVSLHKQIRSQSGAENLVPEGTLFTVAYSYDAGFHFPAGEGQVQLPASGEPVVIDNLPVDAVVRFAELDPVTINGARWLTPVLSHSEVQVAAGDTVTVTVTNTIETQPEPPTPVDPPEPNESAEELPRTGTNPLPLAALATVLIAAGAATVRVARSRS